MARAPPRLGAGREWLVQVVGTGETNAPGCLLLPRWVQCWARLGVRLGDGSDPLPGPSMPFPQLLPPLFTRALGASQYH